MNAFLDKIKNDPKVKELISQLPVPNSEEEAVAGYLGIAKQLGFDFSREDIISALKTLADEKRTQTDKVTLDDADLDHVAGGGMDICSSTYSPNEWCWFDDSCSYIISYYGAEETNEAINRAFGQCMSNYELAGDTLDDNVVSFDVNEIPGNTKPVKKTYDPNDNSDFNIGF